MGRETSANQQRNNNDRRRRIGQFRHLQRCYRLQLIQIMPRQFRPIRLHKWCLNPNYGIRMTKHSKSYTPNYKEAEVPIPFCRSIIRHKGMFAFSLDHFLFVGIWRTLPIDLTLYPLWSKRYPSTTHTYYVIVYFHQCAKGVHFKYFVDLKNQLLSFSVNFAGVKL